jgi:DNA-binding GntR family transcriptional regulator
MVNLPKVSKVPNLTELAYLSVKQHMLNGQLAEGSRLTEEALASQLGISKSPVREALNRLESEGLVIIESRRGAYVRKFSIKETRDIYDLRVLLEVHAVGTVHITPELLSSMEESVERTQKYLDEGNKIAHMDEDIRFHNIIAAGTENQEIFRVLDNVQQKSLLIRSKTYHLSGMTAPISHHKIFRELKTGDREAAQRAMREHILFVRNSLLKSLEAEELKPVEETEAGLVGSRS